MSIIYPTDSTSFTNPTIEVIGGGGGGAGTDSNGSTLDGGNSTVAFAGITRATAFGGGAGIENDGPGGTGGSTSYGSAFTPSSQVLGSNGDNNPGGTPGTPNGGQGETSDNYYDGGSGGGGGTIIGVLTGTIDSTHQLTLNPGVGGAAGTDEWRAGFLDQQSGGPGAIVVLGGGKMAVAYGAFPLAYWVDQGDGSPNIYAYSWWAVFKGSDSAGWTMIGSAGVQGGGGSGGASVTPTFSCPATAMATTDQLMILMGCEYFGIWDSYPSGTTQHTIVTPPLGATGLSATTWSGMPYLNTDAGSNPSPQSIPSTIITGITYTTGGGGGGSSIKTINGLAKASVKTVNGLVIASVKTWNGLP